MSFQGFWLTSLTCAFDRWITQKMVSTLANHYHILPDVFQDLGMPEGLSTRW